MMSLENGNPPYDRYLEEVCQALEGIAVNTTDYRKRFKKGYSFSRFSLDDQIEIWNFIWKNGKSFWIRIQAFFFCESLIKEDVSFIRLWPMIRSWQDDVHGWGLCDALSKIYSRMLELMPEHMFPLLQMWNKSPDPWKRRQSLVSLIYYASVRKKILPFDQIIIQVENLLTDEDYYVQKAIGWSLRELSVPYPIQTSRFLMLKAPVISSIAFSTALSRLSSGLKQEVKLERRKNRRIK